MLLVIQLYKYTNIQIYKYTSIPDMNILNIPTTSDYYSKVEYSKKFKLRRIKDINIYLTYINLDNDIEIISKKKLYIENKQNTITRNQLVDVIKNCQRRNNIYYKLISKFYNN